MPLRPDLRVRAVPPLQPALRPLLWHALLLVLVLLSPLGAASGGRSAQAPGRHVEISGTLEAVIEEDDERARVRHFVRDEQGNRRELVAESAKLPAPGARVRVRGVEATSEGAGVQGAIVAYCCGEQGVEILSSSAAATTLSHTLGEQRTLVLLVNYADNAATQPISVSAARDMVLGTVADFYREASYQRTWLTGDVRGWLTLPMTTTASDSCFLHVLGDAADAAARGAGVDTAQYDRFVYIVANPTCGADGFSTLGAVPSRALIAFPTPKTIAHELGHSFGLWHSFFAECSGSPVDSSCVLAIDDKFDAMGYDEFLGHFNAYQKDRLGWFQAGEVVTVSGDDTFALGAFEVAGDGRARTLRIRKGTDAESGLPTYYYVEYRQALGFDGFIAGFTGSNVTQGVLIRWGKEWDGRFVVPLESVLLDMTPESHFSEYSDRLDVALTAGRSFSDPAAGLTMSVISAGGAEAVVQVDLAGGGVACTRVSPALALSPGSVSGPAGATRSSTLTVSNRDSATCAASTFALSAEGPSGWTLALGSASLNVPPGESRSTTLGVTPPAAASDGGYTITTRATHPATGSTGSATLNHVLAATTSNRAPVAIDDTGSTSAGQAVVVPILVNDSDPDGDRLSIAAIGTPAKGTVSVSPDGMLTYRAGSKSRGDDSFPYTVSDGRASASARVTISIRAGKGRK